MPFVFWRWSWVFRSKCLSRFKSNFYRERRKIITTTYNNKCNDLVVRSSDYKGTIERPFLQHFGLFLGTVRQVLNRCLFLADSLQKFDNVPVHGSNIFCVLFLNFFRSAISSSNSSERHDHYCPSSLFSRQIYHRSTSFPSKYNIEPVAYCENLPNMVRNEELAGE